MDALKTSARNAQLLKAVRVYAEAAIHQLARQNPSAHSFERPYDYWQRTGERTFLRQTRTFRTWPALAAADKLSRPAEYHDAAAALRNDPVIGPQLDQLVGTSLGSSRLTCDGVLDSLTQASIGDGGLSFDESAFSNSYLAMEAELHSVTRSSVALMPIAGLLQAPTMVFGRFELDRFTDDEAQALLTTNLIHLPVGHHFAHTNTEYVLRLRQDLPKLIGEAALNSSQVPSAQVSTDELQDIVSAFRILKDGAVAIPGVVSLGQGWISAAAPLPTMVIRDANYVLSVDDVKDVLTLLDHLRSPAILKRRFIGTAVRRFFLAGERERVEDRFIDLMIAAEALFLSEGRKGETGELTQKISIRFAHFAPIPNMSKRERYSFMKQAYGARSSIVHGDATKNLDTPDKLKAFTDQTADHLRRCLRAMIAWARANPERKPLVDWDELILGT